jgi:hypothetical protein
VYGPGALPRWSGGRGRQVSRRSSGVQADRERPIEPEGDAEMAERDEKTTP